MRSKIKAHNLIIFFFLPLIITNCSSLNEKDAQSVKGIIAEVKKVRDVQLDHAMNLVEKAYLIAQHNSDAAGQAEVLKHRGYLFDKKHNYIQAIDDYEEALILYEKIGDTDNRCKCTNNIGYGYQQRLMYNEATKWLELAEGFCEEARDSSFLYLVYSNLGMSYLGKEEYTQAIVYFKKSLDLALSSRSAEQLAMSYNNVGFAFGEAKDYKSSLEYTEKAIDIGLKNNVQVWTANAYNNLGYYQHFLKGEYEMAISFYLKALDYSHENDYKIDYLFNIGSAYVKLSRLTEAENYFTQAAALARKLNNHDWEIATMRALADAYRTSRDKAISERSVAVYKQLYQLEDDYKRQERDELLQSVNSTNKASTEALKGYMQDSIDRESASLKLLMIFFVGVVVVTVIVIVILGARNWRQHKHLNETAEFFEKTAQSAFNLLEIAGGDQKEFEVTIQQKRQMIHYVIQSASFGERLRHNMKPLHQFWWNNIKKFFSKPGFEKISS